MKKDKDNFKQRYLEMLSKDFPNRFAAITEVINLKAILNLPKGTEHFISDVHGEYPAFRHIMNNVSGVIRDKVNALFPNMPKEDRDSLCTLIYYPQEIIKLQHATVKDTQQHYREILTDLIELASFLSSKYTRSKVRKALPEEFRFVIDELMHAKADEDNNRIIYHEKILDTVMSTKSAAYFIEALCSLIKRLAVDHLHVVGDLFDRGSRADKVIDLLQRYHNVDIQWGNHDVLWMGAAAGSEICAAAAVRINVRYNNFELLESSYGISLRKLAMFAQKTYKDEEGFSALYKAISVICMKLQGQVVDRHPEYGMQKRQLMRDVDYTTYTLPIDGKTYELKTHDLPTVDPADPHRLTDEEQEVADSICKSFRASKRLREQVDFLYRCGSMYKCCNGNLIYHGCVPLEADGTFSRILCNGEYLYGKAYLDYCDQKVREAWTTGGQDNLDFMWYLWCGEKSPLSGRVIKTFERTFINDPSSWPEPRNPYYVHYCNEEICKMILRDFGLDPLTGHIINGHTPIKVKDGESPVKANGKLLVIDGGFSKAYQKVTGIAGYTLIYNSHNLRLKSHTPFQGLDNALKHNSDILSQEILVETFENRRMIADTDDGIAISQTIEDLEALIKAYAQGRIRESAANVEKFIS